MSRARYAQRTSDETYLTELRRHSHDLPWPPPGPAWHPHQFGGLPFHSPPLPLSVLPPRTAPDDGGSAAAQFAPASAPLYDVYRRAEARTGSASRSTSAAATLGRPAPAPVTGGSLSVPGPYVRPKPPRTTSFGESSSSGGSSEGFGYGTVSASANAPEGAAFVPRHLMHPAPGMRPGEDDARGVRLPPLDFSLYRGSSSSTFPIAESPKMSSAAGFFDGSLTLPPLRHVPPPPLSIRTERATPSDQQSAVSSSASLSPASRFVSPTFSALATSLDTPDTASSDNLSPSSAFSHNLTPSDAPRDAVHAGSGPPRVTGMPVEGSTTGPAVDRASQTQVTNKGPDTSDRDEEMQDPADP